MAEDPKDQDPGTDPDPKDQDPSTDPKDQDPKDQDPKDQDPGTDPDPKDPKDQDPEVRKALQRRDAALKRAQKAEDDARKLREKYEPKDEDPEVKANRKLVRAEARVVLTKAGVTETDDQKVLMDVLALDDVDVDTDGAVDSDAIQERLDAILAVARKLTGPGGRRTPRVDTRDRGGEKEKPMDAAKRRRMEMLRG